MTTTEIAELLKLAKQVGSALASLDVSTQLDTAENRMAEVIRLTQRAAAAVGREAFAPTSRSGRRWKQRLTPSWHPTPTQSRPPLSCRTRGYALPRTRILETVSGLWSTTPNSRRSLRLRASGVTDGGTRPAGV